MLLNMMLCLPGKFTGNFPHREVALGSGLQSHFLVHFLELCLLKGKILGIRTSSYVAIVQAIEPEQL